ncbi:DUF6086 family protein [Streptomyces thermoalcalitolerans]|uniref:DUF6086 family protein n=1 Tax=Streptomyces thermoalcalitolerans TaxID=65605 RepID=UPI0031DF970F
MYFQVADEVLWNPSNSVATVFLGQAAVLSRFVGLGSGLGDIVEDECQVDPREFVAFTNELVKTYQETNNMAPMALLKGFASVALVLADRIGAEGVSMDPEYAGMWRAERERQARSMPRG